MSATEKEIERDKKFSIFCTNCHIKLGKRNISWKIGLAISVFTFFYLNVSQKLLQPEIVETTIVISRFSNKRKDMNSCQSFPKRNGQTRPETDCIFWVFPTIGLGVTKKGCLQPPDKPKLYLVYDEVRSEVSNPFGVEVSGKVKDLFWVLFRA